MGLLIGSFIYLISRPPDQTYFIYKLGVNLSLFHINKELFSDWINNMPSFLHIFSFILLTAGLVPYSKNRNLIICGSWFTVDCAFELGQKYNHLVLKEIPNWFDRIPFLESCKPFFRFGTFDINDLFAIALGAIVAYLFLLFTAKKGGKYYEGSFS